MKPRLRAVVEASMLVPGESESEDAVSLASWAADDQEVGLGGVQSKEVCSHPAGD